MPQALLSWLRRLRLPRVGLAGNIFMGLAGKPTALPTSSWWCENPSIGYGVASRGVISSTSSLIASRYRLAPKNSRLRLEIAAGGVTRRLKPSSLVE